ncbi:MAG: hypothetical protein QNK05_13820 [Myxococcota bacterium]|nr:hypothetical protein [Myxococcota bacterium]
MSDEHRRTQIKGLTAQPEHTEPGVVFSPDPYDYTHKGDDALASSGATLFEPPLSVVVERIAEDGSMRVLGSGELLDPLVVGRIFRVSTSGGYALVTSPVAKLRAVSPDLVEAVTSHATYRLSICPAGEQVKPETGDLLPAGPDASGTRSVALEAAPEPGAGGFHVGIRVRVARLENEGQVPILLGRGRLLEVIRVGGSLRFGLDGDAAMVTSAIRRIESDPEGRLEVRTANTRYRVEKLDES